MLGGGGDGAAERIRAADSVVGAADVGDDPGASGRGGKKCDERLISFVGGFSRRLPELIERALYARALNRLCGCGVFTAWNVGEMPEEDAEVIEAWLHYRAQGAGNGG